MNSKDVVEVYQNLENLGIKIWIDGGWSVDALLGQETRPHLDLDIAIQYKDLLKFRDYLESQGYKEIERDEDKKWNFVLGDDKGHEIDVHAFTFDDKGHVVEGIEYPDDSLTGSGIINGNKVRCISPEYMVKFISPWLYKLRDKNFKDITALCEKFGIEYPKEYLEFFPRLHKERGRGEV